MIRQLAICFIGVVVWADVTLVTAETPTSSTSRQSAPLRPNILLILADDLGYGDLSCYNDESKVQTTQIDRLARQGIRFVDAHSPSTVCTPTRYSILTGRMAYHLNFPGVFAGAGGPCLIDASRLTLPGMLQQMGYRTGLVGKWHVGMTFHDQHGQPIHHNGLDGVRRIDFTHRIPDGPISRGFDYFFGTACCPTTDWLYAYIHGDRIEHPPTKIVDKSTLPTHAWSFDCRPGMIAPDFDLEQVDLVFMQKSLEFLDRHAAENPSEPFFLFHSMQAVHLPSFPAPQFQGQTNAGPHGDFIFEMDYVVGRLLAKLDELELSENTLVVFTSDNGPEVGTVINMRQKYQHDGARPWRGMKRDNWEGGHRVPLIVRWPKQVPNDTVSNETTCLTDLMATIAELTGYEIPENAAEDSVSMWPVWRGVTGPPRRDYTIHQTIRLDLAIRQGPWKYLDHRGSGGNNYQRNAALAPYIIEEKAPDAPAQLYNLDEDPGERSNRVLEVTDEAAKLKTILEEWKRTGRTVVRP